MKKNTRLFSVIVILAGWFWFTPAIRAQYLVNFEGPGEVKTAYASGTVNLSGIPWDLTEVLIGTSDSDWKNGERSARLRGYGTSVMTMLQDKPNGIGTISFYYRRYGTDPQVDWKVEYSVNGGQTWIQIGSPFTAPASNEVRQFSEIVNIDGNVRIRIKRATESGTVNRRLNIDDILITDYSGGNPIAGTPQFNPAPGLYFNQVQVSMSTVTPGASIYYTTDGSDPTQSSLLYTQPVLITQNTLLKARAYAEGYDPSMIASGNYTIANYIEVDNLAQLRNSYTGGNEYFKVTGEVVLTFKQTFRNQKYIQDETAAILIDDLPGKITTVYNIGDGIEGIIGSLTVFGNMLQFNPAVDPGPPSSTGNFIPPKVITIAEMNQNFEAYEAQLVRINEVTFVNAGATFANGTVYPIFDNSKASGKFRTTFYDVDYIGTTIPSGAGSIIGILNSRTDGDYITSRSLADLVWYYGEPTNYPTGFQATVSGLSIKLTWIDATGGTLPTGYLLLANTSGTFTHPQDGVPVQDDPVLTDGSAAVNLSYGLQEYTFSGLIPNLTYYFRLYPYTGAGSAIDYKTDGNPPTVQVFLEFIIYPEPTNYPSNFAAQPLTSSIRLTWQDATGNVLPSGYLILGSTQNIFQYPVDGNPVPNDTDFADGMGAINVPYGVQQYLFTGLQQETTYFFIIFPFTNEAQYIDFKTDGQPPQVSATTPPVQIVTLLNTTFNQSWEGWAQISVKGAQVWDRNNTFGIDSSPCAKMSGYANGQSNENEDWLISPPVDLSNVSNPKLQFFSARGYTGPELQVKVSVNYTGQANPNEATWMDLTTLATWPPQSPFWQWTSSGTLSLNAYSQQSIRIAFVYNSTNQQSATWEVDNITVTGETSSSVTDLDKNFILRAYPNPAKNIFTIRTNDRLRITIRNTLGQIVFEGWSDKDTMTIHAEEWPEGIYLITASDSNNKLLGTLKLILF